MLQQCSADDHVEHIACSSNAVLMTMCRTLHVLGHRPSCKPQSMGSIKGGSCRTRALVVVGPCGLGDQDARVRHVARHELRHQPA